MSRWTGWRKGEPSDLRSRSEHAPINSGPARRPLHLNPDNFETEPEQAQAAGKSGHHHTTEAVDRSALLSARLGRSHREQGKADLLKLQVIEARRIFAHDLPQVHFGHRRERLCHRLLCMGPSGGLVRIVSGPQKIVRTDFVVGLKPK